MGSFRVESTNFKADFKGNIEGKDAEVFDK